MVIQDYLRLARRYWRLIAACVATALIAAWVTTPDPAAPGEPDRPVSGFQATHTLIRSSESILGGSAIGSNASMELLALLATTGEVPRRVADRLGHDDPALMMTTVDVTGDNELGTIRVSATDAADGDRAAALSNAVADELVSYLTETSQDNQQQVIEDNGTQLQELEDRIEDLTSRIPEDGDPVLEAQRSALVRQYSAVFERREQLISQPPAGAGIITLERATPIPVLGSGPAFAAPESRTGRLAAALLVGLAAGVGIAFVLFRFSTKLRSREEAEEAFDLPVVAEVPPMERADARAREILSVTRPESAHAEAYRTVRTAIQHMPSRVLSEPFALGEDDRSRHRTTVVGTPTVVLVTSPGAGEGKTTTVVNLAASFAEIGKTVAVVAADAHRPELMALVVEGTHAGDDASRPAPGLVRTSLDRVWLLPTSELVGSTGRRLTRRGFLRDLSRAVDVVLVDTPPLLLSTEAADLAKECDTILLVAKCRRTDKAEAQRATELLGRLSATVLGVVLVGAEEAMVRGGYYYYGQIDEPPRGRSELSRNDTDTDTGGNGRVPSTPAPTPWWAGGPS